MNIPDKAVDAAQEFAYHNLGREITAHDVELIVEAAAPFIAAQALRDYADVVADGRVSFRDSEARGLRERAKWLEAGA